MKNEESRYSIYDKHISISYGTACLTNLEDSVRECLDLADKRMYPVPEWYRIFIDIDKNFAFGIRIKTSRIKNYRQK